MIDFSREEMTGTLYLLGIPVLTGLYATTQQECRQWYSRIPRFVRPVAHIRWFLTWTTKQEFRDATGEIKRT